MPENKVVSLKERAADNRMRPTKRVLRAPSFLEFSTTKFSGLTATKKPDSRD